MSISVDTINLRFNIKPQYDQQQLNELQSDLKAAEKDFKSIAKEVEQSAKEYAKLNDQLKNMKDNRDRLAAQKTRTPEEEQQLQRLNKRIAEHNQKVKEQDEKHGKLLQSYRKQILAMQETQKKLNDYTGEIGLNKLSLNDLTQKQKELNTVIRQLKPGTEDFERYTAELQSVTEQIKKTKEEIYGTKEALEKDNGWKSFIGRMNMIGFAITNALAIKDRIVAWADQYVQSFAKMDDAMTDVMKYTGQTKSEVEDMNETFKQMTTRTPREELNALAGAAGRLGIQGKKDIEGFVDAADKINVALGDDLGEGAIDQIGKLTMVFGEDKTIGLNGAMLATGSAINVLGANSSANTGFITEFTSDMAGMAVNAKIAQTDIMGYASALSQAGVEGKTASGVFAQLITKMFTDPAKFAKAAKLDVKEFTDLLKTDANAAILQFLEGLKANGGFDALAPALKSLKMQGTQAVPVISSLINKIDELKKAQNDARKAYNEGTSIIEEFNNANSSAAAKLEIQKKALNDVAVELGQKLMPIVEGSLSTGTVALHILSEIVSFGTKHIWLIGTLATALAAYTVVVKAHTIATTIAKTATLALNAVMASSPVGWLAAGLTALVSVLSYFGVQAYNAAKAADALNVKYQAQKKAVEDLDQAREKSYSKIAEEKSRIERLTNIIHSNAFSIGERRKAIEKLQGIVPGYHATLTNEGTLHEKNADSIKKHIEQLNNLAMAEALADKMRQVQADKFEAEEKLRKKKNNVKLVQAEMDAHPEKYRNKNAWVDRDGTLHETEGSKKQLELETQRLAEKNAQKEYDIQVQREKSINDYIQRNKGLSKAYTDVLTGSSNGSGNIIDDGGSSGGGGTTELSDKEKSERDKQRKEKEAQAKAAWEREKIELRQQYQGKKQLQDEWHQKEFMAEQTYIAELLKIRKDYGAKESELMEALNMKLDADAKEANYREELHKRKQQESLHNLSQMQAAEEVALAQQQLNGEIKTQEEFSEKKLAVEIKYQRMRLEYLQKGSAEYLAAQKQLLSLELQQQQQQKLKQEGFTNSYQNTNNKLLYQHFSQAESFKEMLRLNEEYHDQQLISDQQFEQNRTEILQAAADERRDIQQASFDAVNDLMASASQLFSAMQQREISQVDAKYKKLIAAAKKQGKDTTKLEEQQEAEKSAIQKKYAQKQFMMNVLQIIASTATGIARLWKDLPFYAALPLTAVVAASGAAQLASAKAAADQAAGLYEGGYSDEYQDGYTRKGNSKDQAGVIPVHKNEFVANHKAVANPEVRPLLDVIDRHQKVGDISMLNATRLLEEAYGRGRYRGGYSQNGDNGDTAEGDILQNSQTVNPELLNILRRIADNTADAMTVKELRDKIRHEESLEARARR